MWRKIIIIIIILFVVGLGSYSYFFSNISQPNSCWYLSGTARVYFDNTVATESEKENLVRSFGLEYRRGYDRYVTIGVPKDQEDVWVEKLKSYDHVTNAERVQVCAD